MNSIGASIQGIIPGRSNRTGLIPGSGFLAPNTGITSFGGVGGSTGLISSGISNIGSSFNFGAASLGGLGGIGGFGNFGGLGGFGGGYNGFALGAMIGAGIATMIAGIGEFIAYKRENSSEGGEDCQDCKGQGHPDMHNYNGSRVVAEYRDEGGFNMSFGDDHT